MRKLPFSLLAALALPSIGCGQPAPQAADLLLVGGRLFTADPAQP